MLVGHMATSLLAALVDLVNFPNPDHGVTYRESEGTNCHGYEITFATVCIC